jgi:hypothetical protein
VLLERDHRRSRLRLEVFAGLARTALEKAVTTVERVVTVPAERLSDGLDRRYPIVRRFLPELRAWSASSYDQVSPGARRHPPSGRGGAGAGTWTRRRSGWCRRGAAWSSPRLISSTGAPTDVHRATAPDRSRGNDGAARFGTRPLGATAPSRHIRMASAPDASRVGRFRAQIGAGILSAHSGTAGATVDAQGTSSTTKACS